MTIRINLSKYEGHTKGPWDLELWGDEAYIYAPQIMIPEPEGKSICKMHEHNQSPEQLQINGCLMADAPLILAEYKKLRKAYEVMGEALRENGTDYCEHCLRVYCDTSDEVLYRHREGRCLT